MRAPFNAVCDLWSGPSATPPNAFRGTYDCRLVLDTAFFALQYPLTLQVGYLTIDAVTPEGPSVSFPGTHDALADYTYSDHVAIPTGAIPTYYVLAVSYVTPPDGTPPYWRADLALLPLF